MRGIVIAGGFGTRLRPLTLTRPKPLMPLVNAPLLEFQLGYLRAAGISEVCFATNYMADAVEGHFGDGSGLDMKITYAVEQEPLDTAGAIRNAYEAISGEDCVVFNGDVIHGFDIAEIINIHREREADVTLTLREVQRPHAFGVVPIDEAGRVQAFLEPTEEQKRAVSGSGLGTVDAINAGLYVMSREAIETIPLRRCNIEREIFPKLVSEGWKVFGDVRKDFWMDIGRPSQYLQAVAAIIKGEVASPKEIRLQGDSAVSPTASLSEDVIVRDNSSVGENCRLEANVEISGSALLENVQVLAGAKIISSIIGEGSVIGPNSQVRNCVLGARTTVTDNSLLGEYA